MNKLHKHLARLAVAGVALSGLVTGVAVQPAAAQICELPRMVTFESVNVLEGDPIGFDLGNLARFKVRSAGCMDAGSVSWKVTTLINGQPANPDDFVYKTGTINFAAGDSADKEIAVFVKSDWDVEPDEDFYIQVTGSTGFMQTDGPLPVNSPHPLVARGRILNDDVAVPK